MIHFIHPQYLDNAITQLENNLNALIQDENYNKFEDKRTLLRNYYEEEIARKKFELEIFNNTKRTTLDIEFTGTVIYANRPKSESSQKYG